MDGKKQKLKNKITYSHKHKEPIPKVIISLIKDGLEVRPCLHGYTQNANEALCHLIWQFCPKELLLCHVSMDTAYMSPFNIGHLMPIPFSAKFLYYRDIKRIKKSLHQSKKKTTTKKKTKSFRKGCKRHKTNGSFS